MVKSLPVPLSPRCLTPAATDDGTFYYCSEGHRWPMMEILPQDVERYLELDRLMPLFVSQITFSEDSGEVTVAYSDGETIVHDDIKNAATAIEYWINIGKCISDDRR